MEERRDQQEIGAGDPRRHGRRHGDRLEQVPVDGPPVHRVALRLVADQAPFRHQTLEQPGVVERLDDGHGTCPGCQQREELLAGRAGPGLGHRGVIGESGEYGGWDRQFVVRGGRRQPQRQDGITAGVGICGESDLAGVLDDAEREWSGWPPADPPRDAGRGPKDRIDLAPRHVTRVGDRPSGFRHDPQEGVGVGESEHPGHAVLLLGNQAVRGATTALGPDRQMQRVADVQQPPVRLVECALGAVHDP
ncbi:MAG: hypothetical protein M3Q27_09420 [Actinomycetota bacterium]|nr:hypothetical protein [Actinomycetota bacterium]